MKTLHLSTIILLRAVLVVLAATVSTSASEMTKKLERETSKKFVSQQNSLADFAIAEDAEKRLEYARFLAEGLIVVETNPIRVPVLEQAAEIYRELTQVEDERIRIKAVRELRSLLLQFGDQVDDGEVAALDRLLESDKTKSVPDLPGSGEIAPTPTEADLERHLRSSMAKGSLNATLELLLLLRRQGNVEEASEVRSQMLFLATIKMSQSDSSVIKLARRYAATLDAEENPEALVSLLNLAAASGSDAVMSIVTSLQERIEIIGRDDVRDVVWRLVASGSDRAMEVVALDLVDNNHFGFDTQDSLWAVSRLEEVGSYRANYLIAKLFYQGVHVQQDLVRAVAAMERMLQQVPRSGDDRLLLADRFSRMNLSNALVAKYALPLYMDLYTRGDTRAITRIGRIVVQADRSGFYVSPADLPLSAREMVGELEAAYDLGNVTAGALLAEIYQEGRLLPKDGTKALKIYEELLPLADGNEGRSRQIEEQIAKITRNNLEITRNYRDYYERLVGLVEKDSPWAKREYGKLLLKGGPSFSSDPERGFLLLLEALDQGYLSAGSDAAEYALETRSKDKLVKIARAYDQFDPRILTPEDNVFLARTSYTLGDVKKAFELLDTPEMDGVAQARFLRAKATLQLGLSTEQEVYQELREIILAFSGDDKTLLSFISDFAKKDDLDLQVVEPILERLAYIADKRQVGAIELAFQLRQKWPRTQALNFRKVVDWCRIYAERGRGGPLTRVTRDVDVTAVDENNFLYLVDTVEAVLPFMPTNGNLRMFVARQYMQGKFRERDTAKAEVLIRQAAKLGNEAALFEIANTFYYGQGVEPDRERAMTIYRDLAFIGSNRSALSLARLYSKGPESRVYETRAFAHFARAATSGSVTAMTELGRSYIAGAGTARDAEKGIGWLEKAAGRGSTEAMIQLYYYYFVQNPTNDNPDAEKWLDALVEADVPDMIIKKAVLLRSRSKEDNRETINFLLSRAEELGNQFARRLKNIYLQDERGEKSK
ncbi:Putative beta-lactamase HcpC precursor [Roseibium album]|nr:Putative beta-lactamase HcpC precursor [Roseibium album]